MTVASITTDDNLAAIIPAHSLDRLTPTGWDDWSPWHQRAWQEILAHLAAEEDPITEDDLADTTQFTTAAAHHVAYQAYTFGRDLEMAEHHRREYVRQLNQINVQTVSGGTLRPWGMGIEMERG